MDFKLFIYRWIPPKTDGHQGSHQGQSQGTSVSNFNYLNKCMSKVGPVQENQMGNVPIERAILNQWSGSRWTPPKTGSFKNVMFCVKYHITSKIQVWCNPKLIPLQEPITTGIRMVSQISVQNTTDSSKAIFQHTHTQYKVYYDIVIFHHHALHINII